MTFFAPDILPQSNRDTFKIKSRLNELFNNSTLSKGVTWYVNFYDLASDRVIYQKNADNIATPASNQKIITTATYFALADTNFFHYTHFILASKSNTLTISDGTFSGDVIISSNANPVISQTWYKGDTLDILLQQVVSSFLSKKITKIDGRLVGDDSFFLHSNHSFATFGEGYEYIRSWEWEDINVFASSISALTFNENSISISATPSPNNNEVIITSYPKNSLFKSYVSVVNFPIVPTVAFNIIDDKVYVVGELFKKWTYSKNIKTSKPVNFFLNYFQFLLETSKIFVNYPSKRLSPSDSYVFFDTLASIYSPKITEILKRLMKESSNFLSENVFYTMGSLLFGQPGDYEKSIRAVKKFFFFSRN